MARRALLQQALLITFVDLALSNAYQQVAPIINPSNSTSTITTTATKSIITRPTLNESLDAGIELSRIGEPLNRSKVDSTKTRGRRNNVRKGRKTNSPHNEQNYDDYNHNSDSDSSSSSDQQVPVVSPEGVAQAKRAARNIQRKMNALSGRLDQIQSRIAEDHQVSNSTPAYGEYSTPYNGDPDNLDSSSMREFGSNDKATDLPSVSSPSSGIVNSNIEAPQSQTSDPTWMSPHNDGDDQENPSRLTSQLPSNMLRNDSSGHVTKWSSPIIKSVIPSRHDLSSISSENSDSSNTIGNELNQSIDNRHDIDSTVRGDQSYNSEDSNSENNGGSESKTPVTNNGPLKHYSGDLVSTILKPNSYALTGSLSTSDQSSNLGFENSHPSSMNFNNNLTTTRYSGGPLASSLSMFGPEWKANQGLSTYFQDLNSKNHNSNKEQHQIVDIVNKNAGAAFKPASASRGSTGKSSGRFQNMTILNSDNDLLNSFSNQQQQHDQPNKMIPIPTIATTTTTSTTKKPEMMIRKQPSSVHTYSANNYGKGSKENAPRTVTIQPVLSQDHYDKAQDSSSFSDAYLTSTSLRNDTANNLNQSPIYWPEFASSYSSANEKNNNNHNYNLNNNNVASSPVSKMLTSAATNSQRYSNSDIGESDTVHAGSHKLVDMEYSPNNIANDKRYFNTLSNNDEQVSRPTRTNLNRQFNQQSQQQQQVPQQDYQTAGEMYNTIMRRQNNVPDSKSTFAGFATKSALNSDDSIASNNSSNLKHRSSGNTDTDSPLNYQNLDSSYSHTGNNDQLNSQQNAFSDVSQASSGVYSNPSDGLSDYGDTQAVYTRNPNHRGLGSFAQGTPLFVSPSQIISGATSSNNMGQQQLDASNLYSPANDGAQGNLLDNSLAYGYQPSSSIGNQRNHEQPGDASDGSNRASLLTTSDFLDQADQTSGYDPRLLYAATSTPKNSVNNYYQTSSANNQDFMQPAATNKQSLIRQQQLSQLTGAILARNPSLSGIDVNSLIQRYQQQQRLLASQIQQQQQQQKQANSYQSDSTGFLPRYSSRDQVIYRRYSPDSGIISSGGPYIGARSLTSGTGATETSQLAANDLVPYSSASQFQPVYSRAGGVDTTRAYRDANLAYYQAALAAAAAANAKANSPVQQQMDQQSTLMSLASPYLSQQAVVQQQQQQQYAAALGGSNNNYSSGGGSLYATSAINSPAFAAYAADAVAASQHLKPIAASPASPSATTNGIADGSQQLQQTAQQQQPQYSTSSPYKKSYLNSLFKPTASSRYYYAPSILSPISYASPTSIHSLYAPASLASATEQMQTQLAGLPQMYAAASPYIQHPSLSGVSFADQAQQYQAFAAANGLSPQYMTDPDMAESSVVPTDSSNTFADASGQTTSGGSSDDNSGSNNNNNNNNGSVSKSGKSMGPWSNIATLMLGILPLGILMSYFMPAVTIAGRKKRELELSGRNFSELLKWRPPSGVLNALMSSGNNQDGSGVNKASAIISELISSISPGAQLYSAVVDNGHQQYNKRRSLVERPSSTPRKSSWDKPQQQASPTSGLTMKLNHNHSNHDLTTTTTTDTYLDMNNSVNTTAGTTLSSPSSSTTSLPSSHQQQQLSQANNNSTASGVKGKLKKAINALNNFIVAASANMKRKHRSSMIEHNWSIPSMIKSSLKLDNLFNVQELKRQLVEKAKEIQLAQSQMAQQQHSFLGKHQLVPVDTPFSRRTTSENIFLSSNKPIFGHNQQQNTSLTNNKTTIIEQTNDGQLITLTPDKTKSNQTQTSPIKIGNSTDSQVPTATDLIEDTATTSSQLETPVTSQVVSNKVKYQIIPEMTVLQDSHSPKVSIISTKSLFVNGPTNNKQPEPHPVASFQPNKDKAADVNNSTRHHLEICLNQFLCRLTFKLSKSLKNTYVASAQTSLDNRSRNTSTQLAPDQVERLTKKYINQLVEQIEAENPSLRLDSKIYKDSDDEPQQSQYWNSTRQQENPLDTLYKNAMNNQCSQMYNCVELLQLEKTLSKMKLRLS